MGRDTPDRPTAENTTSPVATIKAIGVGGGGGNSVTRMVAAGISSVEFIAVNTDVVALNRAQAKVKIPIGVKLTKGLGAGGDTRVGEASAEEQRDELIQALTGADMVFITAGMGGGTGTGAAPVVARISKELGILTIGVVTKPFGFEGSRRRTNAESGISRMVEVVDTLIVIPNERLLSLCSEEVTAEDAFKKADDVVMQGVRAISEMVTTAGEINRDFADIRAIMSNAGPAWMAIGSGKGPNRAVDAAKAALESPLLDMAIEGAKGVLFCITGGGDLKLHEINQAAQYIGKAVDPEANIMFGLVKDLNMKEEVRLTLIATGFVCKTAPATDAQGHSQEQKQGQGQATPTKAYGTVGDEQELDIPTVLRQPRRTQAPVKPVTPVTPAANPAIRH
ncbi:MAG: cell division protein FtsZ [Chloroflexi bacterium]|nr:cell division protein FtsZ [Chloroflexota bacterium]